MLADELFHLGIAEMEEVAGVVPHETILLDGLAIAADGRVGLDDAVVTVGKGGIAEPGGSSADDDVHFFKSQQSTDNRLRSFVCQQDFT